MEKKEGCCSKEHGFMMLLDKLCMLLVIVGAVNWGLVGFFHFDLVALLFGEMSMLARTVYGLVGVSAIVVAVRYMMCCK